VRQSVAVSAVAAAGLLIVGSQVFEYRLHHDSSASERGGDPRPAFRCGGARPRRLDDGAAREVRVLRSRVGPGRDRADQRLRLRLSSRARAGTWERHRGGSRDGGGDARRGEHLLGVPGRRLLGAQSDYRVVRLEGVDARAGAGRRTRPLDRQGWMKLVGGLLPSRSPMNATAHMREADVQ
jgi:hypothetical protein